MKPEQQAIKKSLSLVLRSCKSLLNFCPAGVLVNEEDTCIEIDNGTWVLAPILKGAESVFGCTPRPIIHWQVTTYWEIPGSFNPRDGGTPPDVGEKELGEFKTIGDALLSIHRALGEQLLGDIEESVAREGRLEELGEQLKEVCERHKLPTPDCQHQPGEDCMICQTCGKCCESLRDDDICPDCYSRQC